MECAIMSVKEGTRTKIYGVEDDTHTVHNIYVDEDETVLNIKKKHNNKVVSVDLETLETD